MAGLSTWWPGAARLRPEKLVKRILPRSLFGRALLIIITPVVVLQIVATYVFFERHWDQVSRRLALGVGGDIAMIIELLDQFPGPENRERIFVDALYHMHFKVTLLASERLPAEPPELTTILDRMLSRALGEQLSQPFHIDTHRSDDWIGIEVQLDSGVLRVAAPRDRVASSTTWIFIMWMVGTASVMVVIAVLFMRNQVRPIRRLAEAADDLGKGRPVPNFKPAGATEVRRAAAAFLVMRDRIERQVRQRTEMLAGVSHDLRTPLTRMKLQLAMLGGGDEVASLRSDVAEMEKMVRGYLDFARGRDAEAAVPTDLPGLLNEVAVEARRQGGEVELVADGDMVVRLRPDAIKRCLTNLVDNARRHAARITIEARRRGDSIEVAIDDDGPGIPEELREEAFKPFHRLDPSRNPDSGGSGLGLSIARDVARSHGGDITLSEAPLGGLRALLRLPL
ncbi:MAG: ATP-binding protein [Alphaproteobacteria bacterium]|nr:ATP-binding protein [Alphaproteobacteria bacterium]